MNVVVSLTGELCALPPQNLSCVDWTVPGPWVDLSTFLKLALVPLAVLIWQLASLLVRQFPFPKLALPCPLPQQCLLSVCISVSSFGPARPPYDDHSLVLTSIRMRSHGIFFTMRMRISQSKSACAVTNFFTMRMRISPSHG